MKITYTVDMGERFVSIRDGLAPSNYDATKHDVFNSLSKEVLISEPRWLKGCVYVLELKKAYRRVFVARSEIGSSMTVSSLDNAWDYVWYNEETTKFVVEYVYEDDILIDIIVHKDPKG